MKNTNTRLTPSQVKLKNVLRPIVEGILKEEDTTSMFPELTEHFSNARAMMELLYKRAIKLRSNSEASKDIQTAIKFMDNLKKELINLNKHL